MLDDGEICMDGEWVCIVSLQQVQVLGIVMIYQEFNLVFYLSVVENIWLGCELWCGWFVDCECQCEGVCVCLQCLGVDVDFDVEVLMLFIVQQQMVEIVKVLFMWVCLLIMDEFMLFFGEVDVMCMLRVVQDFKCEGVCIFYIFYWLDEFEYIVDCVMVLCDGQYIVMFDWKQMSIVEIIGLMVGCELNQQFLFVMCWFGVEVLLKVCGLVCDGVFGLVDFELC